MCVVGAVGYFVVKKKSSTGIAVAAGMRDDVATTAKPMDPTPEVNASISTPSTGTDSQGMEGSKSGSKKKKKKGSKRKKQKKQ
ncbi:unnamed protein product [Wuchereria bancrofti]|uniref:Uncharacterized protein n=1 Tax=Wuchereria bancrofti TaxID=6293 RepID=A0A3P7DBV1_WUCBA|nr:unnamed protein product [Wuchereria bancrofti]